MRKILFTTLSVVIPLLLLSCAAQKTIEKQQPTRTAAQSLQTDNIEDSTSSEDENVPYSIKPYDTSEHPSFKYHGNVETKIFHRPGCRYYNCKSCTEEFRRREEAIAAGYKPCKVCKP